VLCWNPHATRAWMTEARWSCWMRRESRLRVWCQWHRSSNAHPGEANKSRCPTPTNALSVCASGAACALGIRQRTETRPLRSRAPRASSSAPQSTEEDAGRPGPPAGCQSRPVLPCGRIAHLEFSGGRPSQDSLRCGWSAHCRGMNRSSGGCDWQSCSQHRKGGPPRMLDQSASRPDSSKSG